MKQVKGFWLPDDEEHLIPFLEGGQIIHGGPTYQYHKLIRALEVTPRRNVAVDVGAHCGLWSRVLQHEFDSVIAFEPVERHRECFIKNIPTVAEDIDNKVLLLPFALGAGPDQVSLTTGPASSGDTKIAHGLSGEHQADMRTLDSFNMPELDFLKIDCEGYEYFVLQGAAATIQKFHPTIIIEQKPNHAEKFGLRRMQGVDLLESWGAKIKFEISGDFCLTWK